MMGKNIRKFRDNEECALALFEHLKKIGQIEGTERDRENIVHDLNNLRGHEWFECLERNLETKPFFDFIPHADWYEDQFAYGRAVMPDVFLKVVMNKECPEDIPYDEIRDLLDGEGMDHFWDYSPEDLDEAINNLSDDMWLLGVGFYEKDGYFARIFEIDQDAYERLDNMLVVTERGDIVLACDVRHDDKIVGPYKAGDDTPSLDAQIAAGEAQKNERDPGARDIHKER